MDEGIMFEIVEHLGVLSTTAAGWTTELNMVSWNGRPPIFDIRKWSPDHGKCSKGLTFKDFELFKLAEIIEKYKEVEH